MRQPGGANDSLNRGALSTALFTLQHGLSLCTAITPPERTHTNNATSESKFLPCTAHYKFQHEQFIFESGI